MNIFVLDNDHKKCAEYHPNQQLPKMVLESCQLMSAAHRMIDGKLVEGFNANGRKRKEYKLSDPKIDKIIYSASHTGHPCTLYTKETVDNYLWLWEHTKYLSEEFTYRTGKVHLSWEKLGKILATPPKGLTKTGLTEFCQCFPSQYKVDRDAVQGYRNYFNAEKQILQNRPAQWKKRDIPYWFKPIKL